MSTPWTHKGLKPSKRFVQSTKESEHTGHKKVTGWCYTCRHKIYNDKVVDAK